MNIDLIRFTDKYLGTLIRIVLYYYQKIRDIFPQKGTHEPYKNILVVKFWGIGNIVRVSPTLKGIRDRFPEAKITFITLNQNKGVYDEGDLFDEVIYLELKSARAFVWDVIKKFFVLYGKQFDLVLNLEPLANFSELVSFYVGVGARVGFTVPGRRSLFTIKVPFREDEHISKTFFRILSPFGMQIPENLSPVPIPVSKNATEHINSLLSREGIESDDFVIAVNVNASSVADVRRWSSQNFAALVQRTNANLDAKYIFIGSPAERARVEEVVELSGVKAINLAGRTDLKQAIAALNRADMFISNDSGPMHLAMALGTPTVALFGPESPDRYGPLSDRHVLIYKGYDCSPCIKFSQAKKIKCDFNSRCIEDITIDEVYDGAEKLYRRLKKSRG
jgi:heptosyltransferase-2